MSYRIHVCDDEPHIVLAVSLKFSKAGFQVTTVKDGQAAWEAIQCQPPQLLITDLQMPRLDGLGLVKRLRADPALHNLLKVCGLTESGQKLFEITRLDHHLDTFDSVIDAVASFLSTG